MLLGATVCGQSLYKRPAFTIPAFPAHLQAKLMNKWEEYLGQLAAEMMGSREEFAILQLRKRKDEAREAMSEVRLLSSSNSSFHRNGVYLLALP